MTNLSELMKLKGIVEQKKKAILTSESKQSLIDNFTKKIKTTMIGAIASLEKHLGDLWGHGSNRKLNDEESYMFDLFHKIRKEILDNGNMQIKMLEKEIANYEVERKKYSLNLPIKSIEGEKNDGQERHS